MRRARKIFRHCCVKEPLSIRPVCKGTFYLHGKKFSRARFSEVSESRFLGQQGKSTQEYWRISSDFNAADKEICLGDRTGFDSPLLKRFDIF